MTHQINYEMIAGYRKRLLQEEYAESTVKKYLRDIRAFITWVKSNQVQTENPLTAGYNEYGRDKTGQVAEPKVDQIAGARADNDQVTTAEPKTTRTAGARADNDQAIIVEPKVVQVDSVTIDKELLSGWKTYLVKTGYAPVTINAMLSSMNGFVSAMGWKECGVKFLKIQRRTFRDQDRELSRTEYERLLLIAERQGNIRLKLLLETICSTGIRVSEVKYITMETLRRRRADISLKGKIRTILIPGKLCKKLRDYAKKRKITSGEIFVTKNGKSMCRRQIWGEMKRLCAEANVNPTKVFPHNLRHLFARTFYKMCKDIVKLADVLGHSSIETTRIYLISTGETHARQIERLGLVS